MLELPGVTLACVDTANHRLALRALAKSAERIRFGRVVLLTDALPPGVVAPTGVAILPIAPLRSREDYSRFVLKSLRPHVATPHVLLVQWDGYVVNADAWQPAFADCDYLGAKWFWYDDGMRVGNGGFSLRSRRLLDALADPRIDLVEAEDLTIGRTFRPLLERDYGIRFGSEDLADRFAFEAAYPIGMPFGFHGLFNFCRVVPPVELAELVPQFSDAIAGSPQLAQLLRNCVALTQWAPAVAIARRILAVRDDAEARTLLAQAETSLAAGIGVGRNDPCPCGSGRKYKQCHGALGGTPAAPTPSPAAMPSPDMLVARALDAHRRNDLATAERDYRAALAIAPEHPHALHFLGVIDYQRGRPADALPKLARAAMLVPGEPEFRNNLGLALAALDRDAEALASYRAALALKPSHGIAWNNAGLSHHARLELAEAVDAYRRALAIDPAFTRARWNMALALLASGDHEAGWQAYEARRALPEFAASDDPTGPSWDGREVAGRRLLLVAEQGLGDAIQFVRFARDLAARGAEVAVRVPAPLVSLLRTAPGVAQAHAKGDPIPPHDAWVPLLSLPALLHVGSDRIAADAPYLRADPDRRVAIADELRPYRGLRVGLAWAGSPRNANDRRRSVDVGALAPLLAIEGVDWFSLQKGDAERALDAVPGGASVVRLAAREDFPGTAALIDELDLVVTVDTSIAHLAGALGQHTFVMLPFSPDWRWGIAGETTAWYPTLRLFRQPAPGEWGGVVQALAIALRERVAQR